MAAELAALRAEADNRRADAEHFGRLEVDVVRDIGWLTSQVAELRATLTRADEHLRATPYVTDPAALRLADGEGRPILGYVHDDAVSQDAAYADFEDLFRGSRADIQARQRPYVEMLRDASRVVDLGCGRGELLELLRDVGVPARGVDLDAGMVAQAAALGLDAAVDDLFSELTRTHDGSLDAVFSAQVIEHLSPADMGRMLQESFRVLTDDGLAIIETVNPHSVRAFRFFWLDTTHTIPVYPESALMMARAAGFAAATIYFPGGTGQLAEDLRDVGDFALICAKNPQRLTALGLLER